MTIAVADAFMKSADYDEQIRQNLIGSMQCYGRLFPYTRYGGMFRYWLQSDNPQTYGSYGDGSAMRVSSVTWLFNDLDTVRRMAHPSAEVSHNHPEGIKGAGAVASAIYVARTGGSKDDIRAYMDKKFEYSLVLTCDEIRQNLPC